MSRSAYDRYLSGASPAELTPGEAGALAEHLMHVHRDVYTNPKDFRHEQLSRDVAALHQRSAGSGYIGPGGEVCASTGSTPKGNLFDGR